MVRCYYSSLDDLDVLITRYRSVLSVLSVLSVPSVLSVLSVPSFILIGLISGKNIKFLVSLSGVLLDRLD